MLNPDENKRRQTEGYRKLREDAMEMLGGECVECGFDDPRALQVDHVNGGGSAEYRSVGNSVVYRKIANGHTDGYQILCANCNWIKRAVMGEQRNGVPYSVTASLIP